MPSTPDIDLSALAEALNEKMDRDMGNHTNTCHYVVETWHSGTEWYRVWSDGWIEQGGYLPINFEGTVTLSKPFSDTNYVLISGLLTSYSETQKGRSLGSGYDKTTTSFKAFTTVYSQGKNWYACGF